VPLKVGVPFEGCATRRHESLAVWGVQGPRPSLVPWAGDSCGRAFCIVRGAVRWLTLTSCQAVARGDGHQGDSLVRAATTSALCVPPPGFWL
jgi:hypothetical protein